MFSGGHATTPYLPPDLYDPMHTPGGPYNFNFNLGGPNGQGPSGLGASLPPQSSSDSGGRPLNAYEMSLDDQERRKLERKRARNRAAASKCRQKKMDRINDLEVQVQSEKARSQMLDGELLRLRTALSQLEHVVQRHRSTGCHNVQQQC